MAGASVSRIDSTPRADSFKSIIANVYRYAILTPETTVHVAASPAETTFHLNSDMSLAWAAHDELADKVKESGEAAYEKAMKSSAGERGAAVASCTIAVYHAAANYQQTGTPTQTIQLIWSSSRDANDCRVAWQKADQEDARLAERVTAGLGSIEEPQAERVVIDRNLSLIEKSEGKVLRLIEHR